MSRLKISAISYLNTAPLMWDFEHGRAGEHFDLAYTIPSGCAEALRFGSADIGIIPSAAYTTIADLAIIPDVAIASKTAVQSILLASKRPLADCRTVAMDQSSMTSIALTKITFARWLGGPREYKPMAPDLETMLASCDCALLIGDPALQVHRSAYHTLDLAEEWNARTGKPFVFAFWAIRRSSLRAHAAQVIAKIFRDSRDHGLDPKNLEQIVQDWAPRLSLAEGTIRRYLTSHIHYFLDPPCLEGLQLFYQYAVEAGALPSAPPLQFAE